MGGKATNFQRVGEMNTAFGNPKGMADAIDKDRILRQCMNLPDEFGEIVVAFGADKSAVKALVNDFKKSMMAVVAVGSGNLDLNGVRDGLCDTHVFAYGAHHLMGLNADEDMDAVVDGVMTRFIKDEADKQATIALHAAKGVTDVYFEGDYPTMVMKSGADQPDAPKGKFLKSASYSDTVFKPA